LARGLVLGHGRKPNIPNVFRPILGPRVFHFTDYLNRIDTLLADPEVERIAVLGGGQSAIEICLDIRRRSGKVQVVNILRPYGYKLRETSPFTRRIFMPESPDYFYGLGHEARQRLRQDLHHTNYSVADGSSLRELNCALYEDNHHGIPRIVLEPRSEVQEATDHNDGYRMSVVERYTGDVREIDTDAVILATGFRNLGNGPNDDRFPSVLDTVSDVFEIDDNGVVDVQHDYALKYRRHLPGLRRCYLNGLCEYSHGLSDSGTFSTLSYRSAVLADAISRDRPQ
jgi:L-ornithine N5-oxygenase